MAILPGGDRRSLIAMKPGLHRACKHLLSLTWNTLAISALVCYLVFAFPAFTARLDNLVYDAWLRGYAEPPGDPSVVVVDIDESSLREFGQLPWPRTILSDLVDILISQGVKAIGLDIWLTEPDRSSPIAVDGQLEKNFGLSLDFSKLPLAVLDNDRYFRNTISGKPVVLGAHATFNKEENGETAPPDLHPFPVDEIGGSPGKGITVIEGLVPPVPILANVAPVGLLNLSVDDDGIVRSAPLLAKMGEDYYPGLALQTLMAAKGATRLALEGEDGEAERVKLENLTIPIGKDGSFRPLFYGPSHSLPYFSAADVLDGKVNPGAIEGKIVFIGPSAHSVTNERSTPLDPSMPGTEIHATITENILNGEHIRLPLRAGSYQVWAICVYSLLGVCLFRFLTLPVYVPISLGLVTLAILISWVAFQDGYFFSPMGAIVAIFTAGIAILPFRYWREQTERKKLRRAFSQYVAPEVVSQIVAGGEELLKGEQKEATIMFSDVRGFTTIAEKLSPPQLVRLLNCYFTPMTACVTARRGTLDKFIGDALMAFWNAPLDIERHPYQAVLAALDMQHALAELRPALDREFGIDMRMGIGINCGLVHVGNMGSTDLMDYTCIGENVNLASRLEGMCKRYGVNIVVSASVKAGCDPDISFLLLDKIKVKGSDKPLKIYTPLSEGDNLDATALEDWNEALEKYFAGSFIDARAVFARLADTPFLRVACQLFIDRCINMEKAPASDWTGVWTYHEK